MSDELDLPIESPQVDEPVDPILTKLAAIEAQNKELIEATRTAQGQARKAEQQAQMAWDAAQRMIDKEQGKGASTEDAVTQLVRKLNDANPAEKLIKDALLTQQQTISTMMGELQVVKGHRQRQEIDAAAQEDRNHTANELWDRAQDMGFDLKSEEFKKVVEEIGKLETGPRGSIMWTEGKKILKEASKRLSADREQSADTYTERRSSTGVRPQTKKEVDQAYADGELSTESYVAWQKAH